MKSRRFFIKSVGVTSLGLLVSPVGRAFCAPFDLLGIDPKGFDIQLFANTGKVGSILKLTPKTSDTSLEAIATARIFFSNLLFDLPDIMKDCKAHFKQIYKTLPREANYYYAVEKQFDVNGNAIKRHCFPLGSGISVVEAYSNYLVTPHIIPDNSFSHSETGHFVLARFNGEDMIFEELSDDYEVSRRSAHILSREKLKKIASSHPIDQSALPASLQYSNHWLDVTKKYEKDLPKQTYAEITELNRQFLKAESEFNNNLKLYNEYKARQVENSKRLAIVDLILQGVSLVVDVKAPEKTATLQNEMELLKQNQIALEKSVLQANQNALLSIRKAQEIRNRTIIEFRKAGTPVGDPLIDVIWTQELY